MTPEELREAKRYGRLGLWASLVDMGLGLAFLAVVALFLARPLDQWLEGFPLLERVWSLRLLALAAIVFALHLAVSFPVSYYALPMLLLILRMFSIVVEPRQNAIARHFERQCDRYALERTGLNEAYLTAFRKLARLNKSAPDPPWLEVVLFHSHPPIRERLR